MKTLHKFGGIAAFYMAFAHLVGIVLFLVVLDYASIIDPMQKLALNVEKQGIVMATNLLMYVIFGFALITMVLALRDRLQNGSPSLVQAAAVIGIIWAGSLIASGMVANAGLMMIAPLYAREPSQAMLIWQGIETVANGLGNANGEILGGTFTLLISLAGFRTKQLPRNLNIFGMIFGLVGIISIIPMLNGIVGIFGLGQIIWFVCLGVVLFRNKTVKSE